MTRTLIDALREVSDRRGGKGRQIALPALLSVSIAALLSGADSPPAILRRGERLPPDALKVPGLPGGVAPCHATDHDVFQSIDADALLRCLGWLNDPVPVGAGVGAGVVPACQMAYRSGTT